MHYRWRVATRNMTTSRRLSSLDAPHHFLAKTTDYFTNPLHSSALYAFHCALYDETTSCLYLRLGFCRQRCRSGFQQVKHSVRAPFERLSGSPNHYPWQKRRPGDALSNPFSRHDTISDGSWSSRGARIQVIHDGESHLTYEHVSSSYY